MEILTHKIPADWEKARKAACIDTTGAQQKPPVCRQVLDGMQNKVDETLEKAWGKISQDPSQGATLFLYAVRTKHGKHFGFAFQLWPSYCLIFPTRNVAIAIDPHSFVKNKKTIGNATTYGRRLRRCSAV